MFMNQVIEARERRIERNFWDERTVQPQEVLRQHMLNKEVRAGMDRILREFALPSTVVSALTEEIIAESKHSAAQFDRRLQEVLYGKCDSAKIRASLDERAAHVAGQIRPFLRGKSLLDIGTGDGMVAWNIRKQFDRHALIDVVNYVDPRVQLPYERYNEGDAIPADDQAFDTAVLTNVLHHSLDPLHLLKESWRVTKERLIIIESVYGDDARLGQDEVPFCLTARDQFIYTSFFDWFYNRVLHSDVPVPFNYLPPQRWERVFADEGMAVVARQDLGIDVEIVPIHHFLYVLERRSTAYR